MFSMILFSLAGILATALADDLVLLFLALELVSVPTYVLIATSRSDIRAQEAGIKYFFLGAMSSALEVYGFSFLYGASGTTSISTMTLNAGGAYATLGLVLAFAGLAYKIAAVPFHVYTADVYQGAASSVTGLLGFFPKLAGFVALAKLLTILQPTDVLKNGWDMPQTAFIFLWIVSAATMTIGNVLGLMQTNVKRMLAYSSIAHSGYMLIGVLVGPVTGGAALRDGVSAMLFYIVVYGLMNLGAFSVLAIVSADGRPVEELDDLAGLARRRPGSALAMAIFVFSLMGMPPTAGFLGKLYLVTAALSAGTNAHYTALVALAIIAVINSAIAAAYYLRIIGACYVREPTREHALRPDSHGLQLGLIACSVAVMLLGLWPQWLITQARRPFHDPQATPVATVSQETSPAWDRHPAGPN
jgi:NADH-quinone oxidoreductase subunit N